MKEFSVFLMSVLLLPNGKHSLTKLLQITQGAVNRFHLGNMYSENNRGWVFERLSLYY